MTHKDAPPESDTQLADGCSGIDLYRCVELASDIDDLRILLGLDVEECFIDEDGDTWERIE